MPKFFSAEMLEEATVEDVAEYPLPDSPDVTVRVRSVSVARMRQYQEAAAKGGAVERRAQAALIADSIIKEDGTPVFDSVEKVVNIMSKVRSRRMMGLIRIISLHNGGEDKVQAEDAEKKSDS